MTMLLSDPSAISSAPTVPPGFGTPDTPTPETLRHAKRVVVELERVRAQLELARRDLDRFIAAAEERLAP